MKTNPDEPAYPVIEPASYVGLTKREEFARAAMQGMLAHPDTHFVYEDVTERMIWAVKAADALIAALNREVNK